MWGGAYFGGPATPLPQRGVAQAQFGGFLLLMHKPFNVTKFDVQVIYAEGLLIWG